MSEDFIMAGFGYHVDIVKVKLLFHPVGNRKLDSPVDTIDCRAKSSVSHFFAS
jgi:hypothetical protein